MISNLGQRSSTDPRKLRQEGIHPYNAKKCHFDGKHRRTEQSEEQRKMLRNIYKLSQEERRNFIGEIAEGDKAYQAVEYSPNFYEKYGSTLPIANFGSGKRDQMDTFIPLMFPPAELGVSYKEREGARQFVETVLEVESLDKWAPAPPLLIYPQKNN
ncbi:spermatogenesis-associated serine-rich protein 1-like [Symsagittifera roscoffensis]|uniref:spermatogenesis-associated serine-rich protein 1-like n=1 Tax=Symsagittifera roscoffensis TaxID=84072 RepID=UPI00307C578C